MASWFEEERSVFLANQHKHNATQQIPTIPQAHPTTPIHHHNKMRHPDAEHCNTYAVNDNHGKAANKA